MEPKDKNMNKCPKCGSDDFELEGRILQGKTLTLSYTCWGGDCDGFEEVWTVTEVEEK